MVYCKQGRLFFLPFFSTQFSEHATTITKAIIRQIIAEKNQKGNNMLMHHSLAYQTQITSQCKLYQKLNKTLTPPQPYSVAVLGKMNKISHLFLALQGEAAGSGQVHLHVQKIPTIIFLKQLHYDLAKLSFSLQ